MAKAPYDSVIVFRIYKYDEDFLRSRSESLGISLGSFLRKLIHSYIVSYGVKKAVK